MNRTLYYIYLYLFNLALKATDLMRSSIEDYSNTEKNSRN